MTVPIYRSYQSEAVPEDATQVVRGRVTDELGADLPGALVTTLKLTLVLEDGSAEGELVGAWNDRDVKNANSGTLDVDGSFRVVLPPGDLVVPVPGLAATARFAALIVWTWGGGKKGRYRHSFPVANLERAP